MPQTITWYLGEQGPYSSGGRVSPDDPIIAAPPGSLEDYNYNAQGGQWIPKTPEEKDIERNSRADRALDGSKMTRAIELLIAELHGLTPGEVRALLRAHYNTL